MPDSASSTFISRRLKLLTVDMAHMAAMAAAAREYYDYDHVSILLICSEPVLSDTPPPS